MFRKVFLSLLLLVILAGCGGAPAPQPGEVMVISTRTTLYWIGQALEGARGTYMLTDKAGNLVILWNMKDQGMGFTMISKTAQSVQDWFVAVGGKANLANYADAKAMRDFLKDNGWKVIAAKDLPKLVLASLKEAVSRITAATAGRIAIFVFPVGTDWYDVVPDGEVQYDA